jgi:hypothetical protein
LGLRIREGCGRQQGEDRKEQDEALFVHGFEANDWPMSGQRRIAQALKDFHGEG